MKQCEGFCTLWIGHKSMVFTEFSYFSTALFSIEYSIGAFKRNFSMSTFPCRSDLNETLMSCLWGLYNGQIEVYILNIKAF